MAKKLIQVVYTVNDQALLKAQASIKSNEDAAKKADDAVKKFGQSAKTAGDGAGQSFLKLGDIWKGLLAIGITRFVVDLGKKILDLGIKQEQLNIAFNTFLGSAEKAKKLIAELNRFAIVTPFTPDQVNSAAKALLAFGVQGEEIIPTLKMLGDVSSGTGKDLTEMAVIFGQIRSTGRLMGQDLLQLINAGFNPLTVISEKTGKSVAQLKKEMEAGAISFEMVADAFKSATSEGGLFFNLMEKQSQSVGGLLSTVSGNIDQILKNVFTANSGPVKEFTDLLVELSQGVLEYSKSVEQLADEKALRENNKLLDEFLGFAKAFGSLEKARAANAQLLAIEMDRLNARQKELETSTVKLTKADQDEYDAISGRIFQIERESKVIDDYIVQQAKKNDSAKQDFAAMEKQRIAAEKLTQARRALIDEMLRQTLVESDADVSNIISGPEDKIWLPGIGFSASSELDKIFKNSIDQLNAQTTDYIAALEDANAAEIAAEEEKQQRLNQIKRAAFDYGMQLVSQAFLMSTKVNNDDLQQQKDNYDKRIQMAGDNENARRQLVAERDAFDAKAEKIRAERERKAQINQMIVQNLQNAVRALGTPPVPNFPLFGLALATGFAQIGIAKATGFKEGVIALDGPGTGTSDSIPARLSRGESVITAKATERSMNLLEAINSGEIDDRILSRIKVGKDGISTTFDDSRIVNSLERLASKSTEEEGYFTVTRIRKNESLVRHTKSKFRS